jgi:diguanylate cyclase (GGDEF)-like protein/PAS domain S-box-containing protein
MPRLTRQLPTDDLVAMLAHAPDAVALLDRPPPDDLVARRFLFVNDAFTQLYQCPADDVVGLPAWEFFQRNATREGFLSAMTRLEGDEPFLHTRLLPRPDGSTVWIEVNFRPLPPLEPPCCRWMFISRDITAARAIQVQNQRLVAALGRASEPIVIAAVTPTSFAYEFVNDAFVNATGYDRANLQGTITDLVSDPGETERLEHNRDRLLRGETVHSHFQMWRPDGTAIQLDYSAVPVVDPATELVTSIVATFHDVTEITSTRQRLEHEATHDQLTGLFNRRYMERRLDAALARAGHVPEQSLLFIDLDRFKQVNDDHGHDVGDRVLYEVARAFQGCLWGSDVLGRWGGDEFVAIVQCTPDRAQGIATWMIASLAGSTYARMVGGASIGIAALDPRSDVIALADEAAYRAKRDGGNVFRVAPRAG